MLESVGIEALGWTIAAVGISIEYTIRKHFSILICSSVALILMSWTSYLVAKIVYFETPKQRPGSHDWQLVMEALLIDLELVMLLEEPMFSILPINPTDWCPQMLNIILAVRRLLSTGPEHFCSSQMNSVLDRNSYVCSPNCLCQL